jgi:hypothetical protein
MKWHLFATCVAFLSARAPAATVGEDIEIAIPSSWQQQSNESRFATLWLVRRDERNAQLLISRLPPPLQMHNMPTLRDGLRAATASPQKEGEAFLPTEFSRGEKHCASTAVAIEHVYRAQFGSRAFKVDYTVPSNFSPSKLNSLPFTRIRVDADLSHAY